MKHYRFHVWIWRVLSRLLSPRLKQKFNFDCQIYDGKGPFLVLSNHNTDWDPLLLACSFPQHVYYVASDHVFRWGWKSKLLRFFFAPISRYKAGSGGDTALAVVRRSRAGANVAIFAEGNRSFTGVTGDIPAATGKLVKVCGADLVTYRIEGGYFTSPRWSRSLRRGKMTGRIMNVYSREQLRAMSAEEVNRAIQQDLHVDAYQTQRREMTPFLGENPAEHLERVLCLCPRCRKIGSLTSRGDLLSCPCGFQVRYNEYGFFEGEDAPYDNITDWDRAQTEMLISMLPEEGLIYSDSEMEIAWVLDEDHVPVMGCGDLFLYPDRLECGALPLPLDEITGISMRGPQTLGMTYKNRHYEISSKQVRCLRKYMLAISHLTGGRLDGRV